MVRMTFITAGFTAPRVDVEVDEEAERGAEGVSSFRDGRAEASVDRKSVV